MSRKLGPVQPPRPLNAATEKPLPLQMDHASAIYHPTVELKSSSTAAFLCLSIHPWSRAATLAPNHHHREATPPTKGSCVHTTHWHPKTQRLSPPLPSPPPSSASWSTLGCSRCWSYARASSWSPGMRLVKPSHRARCVKNCSTLKTLETCGPTRDCLEWKWTLQVHETR